MMVFSLVAGVEAANMGYTMRLCIALAILGSAYGSPFNELRSNIEFRDGATNLNEPAYRLTDIVQPTYQYVDLDVYLDESRFVGKVDINVTVSQADLDQIVLHQDVVAITAVSVFDSNGQIVPLQFPNAFEIDSYYQILMINFEEAIEAGNYTLSISFLGQINENPLNRGFYKGYYYFNDEKRYYATTQFQPFYARNAFPCFDEPQFKSQFVISIVRDSSLSKSYSNMAIAYTEEVSANRTRETFLPTPIISVYLIAYHVSDFVETTATSTPEKPFGIVSRQGVTSQHQYAAEIGVAITSWMDDFFNYEYYSMGQGVPMKNDHIALPDFPSGAMENWGMVNYREAYLLYDPQNTNIVNKVFIATIIAHEMAHKWFGNLVTCFWWSNLWLNESFASFFEYFAAHGADPSLELDDQFVVDYVHSALTSDASSGATPMNWTGVVTTPSITSHFSTTSYAKGASVLKMMEHFVGATTFQKALSYYLRDNAYTLGTPTDMYNAFRTAVTEDASLSAFANVDVGAVFDTWVQNPGAPVVRVDVDMSTGAMTVTQQRFQLSGTIPNTIWSIPLTWTRGGSPDFTDTKPTSILTSSSMVINKPAGSEWVIFNIAQSGLYRVDYDDNNWQLIADALKNNRETIHKLNRAQIVNDVLFFVRAGSMTIERAFDILSFLKDETDYYVWAGALTQLDWIRRRVEHVPTLYAEYNEFLLELLESSIQNLGFNEYFADSTSTILHRMQVMNYACNMGHEACVEDSVAKWNAFRQNENNLIPVNLRRYVYCSGIRNGNYSDYEFLWNKYNTSENTADMVVMLRTLACSRDQTAINHYLQQSMYNDKVRIHDKTNAFQYALQGNPENLATVLNFVYNNYAQIRETYGGSARLNTCLSALAAYLTDFNDISTFQTWLYNNQLNLPNEFATGKAVVDTAISNLQWGNNAALDLVGFLRARSAASSTIAPLSLVIAALVTRYLY